MMFIATTFAVVFLLLPLSQANVTLDATALESLCGSHATETDMVDISSAMDDLRYE